MGGTSNNPSMTSTHRTAVAGRRWAQLCLQQPGVRVVGAHCCCGGVGDAELVHPVLQGAATQRDQGGRVIADQAYALAVLQADERQEQPNATCRQQQTWRC